MKKKSSLKRKNIWDYLNIILMVCICISILYPFLYVLKQSISASESYNISLSLIPDGVSLEAYRKVFKNEFIVYGFFNTFRRTLIGTPLTMIVTILAAYPLSKPQLPHRTIITAFFVFTMFFDGGLIPNYLVVNATGLIDTFWALVIPRLVDTFNLIILRNYFMSIPTSLEESAKIDGAGDLRILAQIILPVSLPILATVGLWTIVNHWNWWFDSLIYIQDARGHVLQTVLRRIILEGTTQMMDQSGFTDDVPTNPDNLKGAVIMVTTIPIVCVYPFLQKYFVKGIMVGSLKG